MDRKTGASNGAAGEEERLYDEAMESMQQTIAGGGTYEQACEAISIEDSELRAIVQEDFLRIMIANFHFGQKESLKDLAIRLSVSEERLQKLIPGILHDIGMDAAEKNRESGGTGIQDLFN